jgi:ubiquinone/menaquinone biosynthesis C-methylase UbiE
MANSVCPWWLGSWLASPLRRLSVNPESLLGPFVSPGMTVLEPGPGMGFFTIPLARMVGENGRIIALDVQQKMLDGLERRARRAGLRHRIELRLVGPDGLRTEDLAGRVDFALAFAMVHEVDDPALLFLQVAAALKRGGRLLFCEPAGHVPSAAFAASLDRARAAGFTVQEAPAVRGSHAALLKKR